MSLTGLIRTLSDKAKSCVRDLDPQNDLTFLRIRTKKQEILVAPGKILTFVLQRINFLYLDKDYLTIVLQANDQS
jgi:dynein light chain roadblock-type